MDVGWIMVVNMRGEMGIYIYLSLSGMRRGEEIREKGEGEGDGPRTRLQNGNTPTGDSRGDELSSTSSSSSLPRSPPRLANRAAQERRACMDKVIMIKSQN